MKKMRLQTETAVQQRLRGGLQTENRRYLLCSSSSFFFLAM